MGYSLSGVEREVVISFNAAEDTADLYTADPVYIRKLDKLAEQNPEQFKEIQREELGGQVVAKRYEFPKRFITIRSKDTKRELTEEQRTEIAERLKSGRRINSTVETH